MFGTRASCRLGFLHPKVTVCITSFDIQKLCMLSCNVHKCCMILTFNIISLNSINCLAFIMGIEFVLCETGNEYMLYSED